MEPSSLRLWMMALLGAAALLSTAYASLEDPHPFPHKGPFFEGWYFRITVPSLNQSFAAAFGNVLPEGATKHPGATFSPYTKDGDPPAYLALLHQPSHPSLAEPLQLYDAFPPIEGVAITPQASVDPPLTTPSSMRWCGNVGCFWTKADGGTGLVNSTTHFSFSAGEVSLEGDLGQPVPWSSSGKGPMGWAVGLPVPIKWFVYSVASPVHRLRWTDSRGTQELTDGFVHLEKNWGKGFPTRYVWAQCYDPSTEAYFALSFGGLGQDDSVPSQSPSNESLSDPAVPVFLVGFRNPKEAVAVDFRRDTAVVTASQVAPEAGFFTLSLRGISLASSLQVTVRAEPRSFSKWLRGPVPTGFRKESFQSFSADARVVYTSVGRRIRPRRRGKVVSLMSGCALEFGGTFAEALAPLPHGGVPAAIDCKGVWGAWSVCDKNCVRRRTYQVLTEAQGGGKKCLHDDGDREAQLCTEEQDSSCGEAAECEGRWGEWGECDSQCRRTRRFTVEGNCPSKQQTDQMQVATCPPDMCQSTKPSGGDQFLPKSSQEGSVTVDLTLNVQYGEVADVATVFTDTLSNCLSQLTEVPRERLSVDMATPPLSEDNEEDNVTVEVVIAKGDQPSAADVLAKLRERYAERLRMGRFGNDVRIIGLDGKVQAAPAAASVGEPVPGDGDSPVLPIGLPVIFGVLSAFIIMVALVCGGWCMCRRCRGKERLLQSADDSSPEASHSSATGSTARKADMKSCGAPQTGQGFGYDGMKDEAEDMGGDISLGVAPTPTSQTPSSRSVVPEDLTANH